jgi:type IV secretion system protein VirD4
MSKSIQQQPQQIDPIGQIFVSLMNPTLLTMGGILLCLILVSTISQNYASRPALHEDRFAKPHEISKGIDKGKLQILKGVHNEAALSIGSNKKLVLPDANASIAVVGKSGSGKTGSVVDSGIDDAIAQGWSLVIYDVKGELIKRHAAYAAAKGYEVYYYRPGHRRTHSINFLDAMTSHLDDGMADQIAHVLNANFQVPGSKPDPFFGPQGDALMKTVFMMAKDSPYKDLPQAWQLLSLPDLAQRFIAAKRHDNINPWVSECSKALMSASDADQTVAGIVTSAMVHFQPLVSVSLLPCLLQTNIPLQLTGKQVVFVQPDLTRQSSTSPLAATAIQMLVSLSVNPSLQRDRPFGLFLDEFDTIRLPDIKQWITLHREMGQVTVLGYQSDNQPRFTYGKEYAKTVTSSVSTTILFNPNDTETADDWSKRCGTKDVYYRSRTINVGGRSGGGSSLGDQIRSVPVMSSSSINRLPRGKALIFSDGFGGYPVLQQFKIPRRDWNKRKRSAHAWETYLGEMIHADIPQWTEEELYIANSDRELSAQSILMTPQELEELSKLAATA